MRALTDQLFSGWQQLLQQLGVEPFTIRSTFAELVAAYSQRDRYYHILRTHPCSFRHSEYVLAIAPLLAASHSPNQQ